MALAENEIQPLLADKDALRRLLDAVHAEMGFVPDPGATAEKARALMLAQGIRPEDNEFSRDLIRMRDE